MTHPLNPKPTKSERLAAVQILQKVIVEKRSLSEGLSSGGLTQEICYGTLRWYLKLEELLKVLLKKPLKEKDIDIHLLLIIGLYQLLHLRIPEHAAVSETVQVAHELKKSWAAKLINGVLREFLRKKASLIAIIDKNPAAQYSHPPWLYHAIRQAWPHHWQHILQANNQHPPFTLRVNLNRQKREAYMPGELHLYNSCGITLAEAQNVDNLLGFHDGCVSVQDGAAQLAAGLLELRSDQVVLDACAAPGGKTAHILETEPQLANLIAVEKEAKRATKIEATLKRLGFNAPISDLKQNAFKHDEVILHKSANLSLLTTIIIADAAKPETWWNRQLFDRILLDAPCSATGVIRRHPDIKFLRQPKDIVASAKQQLNLLNTLWPLLKPSGILLYATCSIMPEENVQVIQQFLANHSDAEEYVISANWGLAQIHGRQILPGMNNMDGFYYARLKKLPVKV